MRETQDLIEDYLKLAKVEMPPETSEEVWRRIETTAGDSKGTDRTKTTLRRLAPIGAGCAAVCILVIGLEMVHQSSLFSTNASNGRTVAVQPSEIISGDWTLAIYHSLLKSGPYYEFAIVYTGQKALPITNTKTSWGGSTGSGMGTGSPRLQPGETQTSFSTVYLPHGLAKTPPVIFSWSGSNGQHGTETFSFANAKPDVQVTNVHDYVGHDGNWTVQYAYETVQGQNFSYPYGVLQIKYNGKQAPKKFSFTLNSSGGKRRVQEHNVQGNLVRISLGPTPQAGRSVFPAAYATIQSQGTSYKITLKRQQIKKWHLK